MKIQSSWIISLGVHFLISFIFVILYYLGPKERTFYEVPIIVEEPKSIQNLIKIEDKPKVSLKSVNESPKQNQKNVREVFGANRNALTDKDVSTKESVEFKRGNTITKEFDEKILSDDDVDSLPAPVDEYLVSQMPSVLSEVRPVYPKDAKEKGLEGVVVLDILIDDKGDVRTAEIVEGLNVFYQVALEAIKKFKFRPAQVDGKSVAVKIRYNLKFELEY